MPIPIPVAAADGSLPGQASMQVSPAMWGGLALLVVILVVVDFFVFGRGRRRVTVKEAAIWSVGWLLLALVFGAVLWNWGGPRVGSEYLAGYLLERSLSLDNIFVFAVQPRVLAWGIALALLLRLVFILVGAALLASFHATFYVFGAILLYTAWKLYHHDDSDIQPEHNPALKALRRHVPMTPDYNGHRLTARVDGRRLATPLLAVLLVVATTDVIFAIDSIPAIFAITQEAFIVFSANAFALLGMRALYFTLVGAMDRFVYLSYGLAVILAFIGAKMLLIDVWHPPIWMSLAVIIGVLVATALISVHARPRRPQALDASRAPEAAASDDGGDSAPGREEGSERETVGAGRTGR